MYFKATAKLVYDPFSAKASRKGFQSWWLIAKIPNSITQYYVHWISKELKTHVNAPIWKSHVSVIRGETPKNKEAWKKYNGKVIEFEYNPEFKMNDNYFWLPVKCQFLCDLRTELGLTPYPKVPFHITICNVKNATPLKEKKTIWVSFPWEQF